MKTIRKNGILLTFFALLSAQANAQITVEKLTLKQERQNPSFGSLFDYWMSSIIPRAPYSQARINFSAFRQKFENNEARNTSSNIFPKRWSQVFSSDSCVAVNALPDTSERIFSDSDIDIPVIFYKKISTDQIKIQQLRDNPALTYLFDKNHQEALSKLINMHEKVKVYMSAFGEDYEDYIDIDASF